MDAGFVNARSQNMVPPTDSDKLWEPTGAARQPRKSWWHSRQRRSHRDQGDDEQSSQGKVDVGSTRLQTRTAYQPSPLRPGRERHDARPQPVYIIKRNAYDQSTIADPEAGGSPKVAFSAGLPTRIASSELTKPFDIHTEKQNDITVEEHDVLRSLDIQRILTSLRLLGYEVNHPPSSASTAPMRVDTTAAHDTAPGLLQGAAATFFHENADPLQRLWALIITFHQEIDRLMATLGPEVFPFADRRRWQEEITMGLMTQISPALGRLGERVTGQVAAVLREHEAGIKFFGGRGD